MASGINLKVSPETLKAKSTKISTEISALESEMQGLKSIIDASMGYWEGDASNKHQNFFKEVAPDMNKVLNRLKEHPTELLKMAELYDKAEADIITKVVMLSSNVIQ